MADQSNEQTEAKARGGYARAQSLTPEERKAIARKAALSRWDADIPVATHEGEFPLAGSAISAAVLPNGKRLITQATFLRALGRSRSPKAGTGVLSTVDGIPFFLQAEALKPFISSELIMSTTPIFYRTKSGGRGVGYDAELLPNVCEVYLKFRDACLTESGAVPTKYQHIVKACDIVMRGLAQVGIIALVDEATGFQYVRDRKALQEILEQYFRKTLAAWVKTFPDEFYEEMYRLRGWEWRGMGVNRYSVVAHYTKDLVYERLAPDLLIELEKRAPKDEDGKRKGALWRMLSEDVGNPALKQHLHTLVIFMRAYADWEDFYTCLNRALPKMGGQREIVFGGWKHERSEKQK